MALPAYVAYDRAANPAAILSLLDELERLERDNSSLRQDVRNAFDDDLKLATMRDQEAAIMKLEQYRKLIAPFAAYMAARRTSRNLSMSISAGSDGHAKITESDWAALLDLTKEGAANG